MDINLHGVNNIEILEHQKWINDFYGKIEHYEVLKILISNDDGEKIKITLFGKTDISNLFEEQEMYNFEEVNFKFPESTLHQRDLDLIKD